MGQGTLATGRSLGSEAVGGGGGGPRRLVVPWGVRRVVVVVGGPRRLWTQAQPFTTQLQQLLQERTRSRYLSCLYLPVAGEVRITTHFSSHEVGFGAVDAGQVSEVWLGNTSEMEHLLQFNSGELHLTWV